MTDMEDGAPMEPLKRPLGDTKIGSKDIRLRNIIIFSHTPYQDFRTEDRLSHKMFRQSKCRTNPNISLPLEFHLN